MSLALATLIYEWRRYMAAVIALAFSGLLILAQVGMFTGIVRSVTATIDRSRADIMVLAPKAEGLINGGNVGLPRRILPQMYTHPEVVEVASFEGNGGMWMNQPKDGSKRVTQFVAIRMVDPRPGAVTLPTDYSEATRIALLEPAAIAVDETALKRLGVKLGDSASVNGRTVKVRAILKGYADINQATIVMSRDSMRTLFGAGGNRPQTGPLMISLRDPSRAEAVRDELNARSGGAYRAWTRPELATANEKALMQEQIIGIMLGFSVFLGFLIGVGITSQTLRGAILANIKEFASLRALGVGMGSLRVVVLELSFWVGVVGVLAAGVFTFAISLLAKAAGLILGFPPTWIAGVTVLLLAIAMVSGLMALGILKKSQPADLLR
jgi:putative ABC transport system permease protein